MIVNNLMSIIWCCSVLLGVSTLKIKNPKALKIINYSVLILLILLMSCNNNCYDEMNIAYSYRTGDFSKEVVLFNVLLSIGRNLGLSFGVFNFITIGVALLLIVSSLKEFTAYWGFLLGGYSFASALLDTSLYRQFIASSVIILGFKYLIGNNKSIKKYVLAVLIAALIHTSFIIYLVFVIVLLHPKQKIIFLLDCTTILYVFFTFVNGRNPPGLRLISSFVNTGGRLEQYIDLAAGGMGWLYPLSYCLLSVMISYAAWKSVSKSYALNESEQLRTILDINKISLVFMPLCLLYMVSFSRLYRPLIWLQLLTVVLARQGRKNRCASKLQILLCGTYLLWYFISFNYLIYDWHEVVSKIFQGTPFFI